MSHGSLGPIIGQRRGVVVCAWLDVPGVLREALLDDDSSEEPMQRRCPLLKNNFAISVLFIYIYVRA